MSYSIIAVGLPESGKTTYIGALFHMLRTERVNAAGLRSVAFPGSIEYVMQAEADWLRFESPSRTKSVVDGGLEIDVADEYGEYRLEIPDIRGEEYQDLWVAGSESGRVRAAALQASSVLLFVRADTVAEQLPLETERIRDLEENDQGDLADWDPDSAPTQTKLAAILEAFDLVDLPIAVVITAWDTVGDPEQSVDAWLQRRLPLLWQLLSCRTRSAAFGVSAQGVDLADETKVDALADLDDVGARLVDPSVRIGDELTEPIGWLRREYVEASSR